MREAKLALLMIFISQAALSFPNVCLSAFRKLSGQELRYIDPAFLKGHSSKYTHEVKTTPISDQCNYGSCWAHARLSHIEAEIKKRTGKEVKLSRHYLITQSLLDRIDDALENPNDSIFAGGNAYIADNLVKRFGLVPDDSTVWKPKINFERSPHAGRLLYFLNARAAKFHLDAQELVPESADYLKLQEQARVEMRDILKAYTGKLPKNFQYAGNRFTPKQFAKKLAPQYATDSVWVYPEVDALSGNLKKENRKLVSELPSYTKATREPIEKIEKRIIESIQTGKSVTLSFENNTLFFDRETGIMSLHAFRTPGDFMPPPRSYREAFLSGAGHHAVDIVGVDLDPDGRLIKLKIKNSWGTDSGDSGFYHMYRDYFEHFLTSIYLNEH